MAFRRQSVHPNSPLHWVPAFAGTTKRGDAPIRPVAPHTLVIPARPESRSAPGYEPMCLRARPVVEPFVALPPSSVHQTQTLHWVPACAGTTAWGTDQVRWHLIRSSFRRRPESRSAPGYERTCAAGTAAWSSRLWPCHRRACIQTQTPRWVPACAGTTKLRRWLLSSVPCRRQAGRLVPVLRFRAGTSGWKASAHARLLRRYDDVAPVPLGAKQALLAGETDLR